MPHFRRRDFDASHGDKAAWRADYDHVGAKTPLSIPERSRIAQLVAESEFKQDRRHIVKLRFAATECCEFPANGFKSVRRDLDGGFVQ